MMKDKVLEWLIIGSIVLLAIMVLVQALAINHLGNQMVKFFVDVRRLR